MYIAGETPAFPLNLIKRRLLPLGITGTRREELEGGIEKGGTTDRAVCFLAETKRAMRGGLAALDERMESRGCSITTMKFHRGRPEILRLGTWHERAKFLRKS